MAITVVAFWLTYFVIYSRTTTPFSSTVVIASPVKLKSAAVKGTAFASPPAFAVGFLIEVMKPPSTSGTLVQILPNELLNVVCEVIVDGSSSHRATACSCVTRLPTLTSVLRDDGM